MPDEPTIGEVVRRLASIAGDFAGIRDEMRTTRDEMRTDFVRKETYNAHRDASKAEIDNVRDDVTDLKTDRSNDAKWRRTVSLTLAVAAVGWLVTIVIALVAALR
ncbi:MAG TPA: hypothetical protein VJL80_14370 [Aeromicrobium sp.]|nr:hypothetical protein [Aeromicrobium sp.]HKY59218.1 hypothetical protein [Aeromicrobium sp.]